MSSTFLEPVTRNLTNRMPRHAVGFTLTEMAVVLAIIALLIGGMLMPLTAQVDQRNYNDTEKTMKEICDALMGFAASHSATDTKPYLPCPDTDGDGREDRVGGHGPCTSIEGRLPWVDLGLGDKDAWGNRFRYRVTAAFSNNAIGFSLTPPTSGTLRVCADTACTKILANTVPAVIISHGKNGFGAYNSNPPAILNPAATDPDEIENTDIDNDFVSRGHGQIYDDVVVWLSTNILIYRMVAAGRLP